MKATLTVRGRKYTIETPTDYVMLGVIEGNDKSTAEEIYIDKTITTLMENIVSDKSYILNDYKM